MSFPSKGSEKFDQTRFIQPFIFPFMLFNTNVSIKCTFMYRKKKAIHINSSPPKVNVQYIRMFLNGDWIIKVSVVFTNWFNSEHSYI